jgi:hypothetical protein
LATPILEIKIGGRRRDDVDLVGVTLRSGFSPSTASLSLPLELFSYDPVGLDDSVKIYVNKHMSGGKPIFEGFVASTSNTLERNGEGVTTLIEAQDERGHLYDSALAFNYNDVDPVTHEPIRNLTVRAIVADIHSRYQTFQESQNGNDDWIDIDLGAFPNTDPGPVHTRGQTHGAAIEMLTETFSEGARQHAYLVNGFDADAGTDRGFLSTYTVGVGTRRSMVFGVDPLVKRKQQSVGALTVKEMTYGKTEWGSVNRVTAASSPKVFQVTVPLTPAWPGQFTTNTEADNTLEADIVVNRERYTTEMIDEQTKNPNFLSWARFVGTRYTMPLVTSTDPLTGDPVEHIPNVLPNLLDDDVTSLGSDPDLWADPAKTAKARPFVTINFVETEEEESESTTRKLLRSGFSTDRQFVYFSQPLYTTAFGVDNQAVEAKWPVSVRLTMAYESRNRLLATESESTLENGKFKRALLTNPLLGYEEVTAPGYKFDVDGDVVWIDETEVRRDDTVELEAWASARVQEHKYPSRTYTIVLDGLLPHIKVGDTVRLNGVDLPNISIASINYNIRGIETTVQVRA